MCNNTNKYIKKDFEQINDSTSFLYFEEKKIKQIRKTSLFRVFL